MQYKRDMEKQFEILKANRLIILKVIENLSLEQLNKIPEGFRNNIAWNVAHLAAIQQLLCYNLSGLKMTVSKEMVEKHQKGTAPTSDITQQELEEIKTLFLTQVDTFKEDYNKKIFMTYNSYRTSVNVTLNSIEDAIEFNNFHEGIHLGYILALKNSV
ncbi:MAG: DinB family protein [Flavobacteriaceae bacterium]|nr:DinB family protein [Flavobacteriaceae bacterium]